MGCGSSRVVPAPLPVDTASRAASRAASRRGSSQAPIAPGKAAAPVWPIDRLSIVMQMEEDLILALSDKKDDKGKAVPRTAAVVLLKASWLLDKERRAETGFRLKPRQAIDDDIQNARSRDKPFLTSLAATALLCRCDRSIAVVSYGWGMRGDPDPTGKQLWKVCGPTQIGAGDEIWPNCPKPDCNEIWSTTLTPADFTAEPSTSRVAAPAQPSSSSTHIGGGHARFVDLPTGTEADEKPKAESLGGTSQPMSRSRSSASVTRETAVGIAASRKCLTMARTSSTEMGKMLGGASRGSRNRMPRATAFVPPWTVKSSMEEARLVGLGAVLAGRLAQHSLAEVLVPRARVEWVGELGHAHLPAHHLSTDEWHEHGDGLGRLSHRVALGRDQPGLCRVSQGQLVQIHSQVTFSVEGGTQPNQGGVGWRLATHSSGRLNHGLLLVQRSRNAGRLCREDASRAAPGRRP